MFKKITIMLLSVANAIFMLKFALPKLMAADVSVRSFQQFAEVLPVNANVFMYFTGVLEMLVALVFIASVLLMQGQKGIVMTVVGLILLVGTLSGALLTEYFIRPAPIDFLVQLCCIFLFGAAIHLYLIRNEVKVLFSKV